MQGWRKTTAEILTGMKVDPGVTQQILLRDLITVPSLSVRTRSHTLEEVYLLFREGMFKEVILFLLLFGALFLQIVFKLEFKSS